MYPTKQQSMFSTTSNAEWAKRSFAGGCISKTIMDSIDDGDDSPRAEPNPCIDILCKKLNDKKCNLQVLYLNNCDLEDDDGINLVKSMNSNMRKLYLNKNRLTKNFAIQFADIIDYSDIKLREIGLKWNQINGEGGCTIADVLVNNKFLKMLDLSWNKIG